MRSGDGVVGALFLTKTARLERNHGGQSEDVVLSQSERGDLLHHG